MRGHKCHLRLSTGSGIQRTQSHRRVSNRRTVKQTECNCVHQCDIQLLLTSSAEAGLSAALVPERARIISEETDSRGIAFHLPDLIVGSNDRLLSFKPLHLPQPSLTEGSGD